MIKAAEAKHTDRISLAFENSGIDCFYVDCNDTITHKKILSSFIENDMISKIKTGK